MPNLLNCSKCNSEMTHGGIDMSTGEIVCPNCITDTGSKISSLSGLKKLISLHLDELCRLSIEKKDILDSIQLLDVFLYYHIQGIKKVKSMDIVRSILNEEKKYNFNL